MEKMSRKTYCSQTIIHQGRIQNVIYPIVLHSILNMKILENFNTNFKKLIYCF